MINYCISSKFCTRNVAAYFWWISFRLRHSFTRFPFLELVSSNLRVLSLVRERRVNPLPKISPNEIHLRTKGLTSDRFSIMRTLFPHLEASSKIDRISSLG